MALLSKFLKEKFIVSILKNYFLSFTYSCSALMLNCLISISLIWLPSKSLKEFEKFKKSKSSLKESESHQQ